MASVYLRPVGGCVEQEGGFVNAAASPHILSQVHFSRPRRCPSPPQTFPGAPCKTPDGGGVALRFTSSASKFCPKSSYFCRFSAHLRSFRGGRPPSEGLTFISRLRQPCTTGACPSRFKIHGATPPSPMAIRIASLPPPPPWTCLPGWAPGDVTATTAWLLDLSASSAVAMGDSGSGVQLLRLSRPISLTRVSGISPSCPCRIVAASFSGPPLVAPKMGLDSVLGSNSRFSGAVGLASPG